MQKVKLVVLENSEFENRDLCFFWNFRPVGQKTMIILVEKSPDQKEAVDRDHDERLEPRNFGKK